MFRGAARGKVFQTIDLGAGMGRYIEGQAARHPKRKYAAVDPLLQSMALFFPHGQRMQSKGVSVGFTAQLFLDEIIRKGWRTRHLNMDMPYPWHPLTYGAGSRIAFLDALERIPRVLLPNGKFYIASESQSTLHEMMQLAEKKGFSVRETKPIPALPLGSQEKIHDSIYRTGTMNAFRNKPIYRMEITYNLKKAIPLKEMRKKLSGTDKIISRKK